jgi:iron complex transport system ATP-binding protein
MLEVRGLQVAYGKRDVLRSVDLRVDPGEVVGLVGPNGCGKTTLLRAVTRLTPWRAGEVAIGGELAQGLTRRELACQAAVVPQSPVLPAGFTALDIVVMGRTPRLSFLQQEGADDYRIARDALSRVDAADIADRRVDELSGGERQRVVLARALAQEAPLLLLDEPVANLDIGHQMSVFQLLRELAARERMAVLVTIHELVLASLYCDRVALMADGAIIADGRPAEVLTSERIARAYGARVLVLDTPGLPAPVVVPYGA